MSNASRPLAAILSDFNSPVAIFRGAPFWSWNGTLRPDELRRQIRQMHEAGLGGFFMHSRVGLGTPYLQPEWFDAVAVCVEEARRLGMKAYLYDEDRWPSGTAGGQVTCNEAFRWRYLKAIVHTDPGTCSCDGAPTFFRIRLDGDVLTESVRLDAIPASLDPGEALLECRIEIPPASTWFNQSTYLDVMNPDAVDEFIRLTHEAYFRRFGADFGNVIPAIFTDEPCFHTVNQEWGPGIRSVPWTPGLEAFYRERYHEELSDHLPELFFPLPEGHPATVLWRYMECITTLFAENYAGRIGRWCDQHGIDFTGHFYEDDLLTQARQAGSCMRFYEHMQIPGMDQLTEFGQLFAAAKQVASVAHQCRRQWRLTETYGCTGWEFNFAGHKAIGDWQAVLGINRRCQHLAWYTMEQEAKRDYPGAISRQSPWFPYYRAVEDYFGRLHVLLSEGEELRDILMIHPVESIWMLLAGGAAPRPEAKTLNAAFLRHSHRLLEQHLDFDYGDEDFLRRHGSVARVDGCPILRVGAAVYHYVAVPPLRTIRASTLRLLEEFAAAGGTVLVTDPDGIPDCVDAVRSDAAKRTMTPWVHSDWLARLRAAAPVSVAETGEEAASVLYQLRRREDGLTLMLCNTGFAHGLGEEVIQMIPVAERTRAYPALDIRVALPDSGEWVELSPETGDVAPVEARLEADGWHWRTALAPLSSRFFVLAQPGSVPVTAPSAPQSTPAGEPLSLEWRYQCEEPNAAVFDSARFRLNGGGWHDPEDLLALDDRVRETIGAVVRGGDMVQPWARQRQTYPAMCVELAFEFECGDFVPAGLCWGMERPESARVTVNGMLLDSHPVGFWTDESLRTLAIPAGAVRPGRNRVGVAIDYDANDDGLEAMFLLGDFALEVRDGMNCLRALPDRLPFGDVTALGLPNYSGNLNYVTEFTATNDAQPLHLRIPEWAGTAVRVVLNGDECKIIGWPPYEVWLTPHVKAGVNRLTLELLGTRRNSHGPFYHGERFPLGIGPNTFRQRNTPERLLLPFGILRAPELRRG